VSAYLAAVYPDGADCQRDNERGWPLYFRRRALVMGVITGLTALLGSSSCIRMRQRLFTGPHAPWFCRWCAGQAWCSDLCRWYWLVLQRFVAIRITAALAVIAVLWAWGLAQYPDVLAGEVTVSSAAAPDQTLLFLVVVAVHRLSDPHSLAGAALFTVPVAPAKPSQLSSR